MALVERFLNPASSGGDGTTSALSGAQAAYATFSAWQTAEATNLVTDGDVHKLHCNGGAITENISITGWTTDATNYILITVDSASRHDGTPGTGFRMVDSVGTTGILSIAEAGTIVEFLEVENTAVTSGARGIRLQASDCLFVSCIGKAASSNTNTAAFVVSVDDGGVWINCLAYECGNDGFQAGNFDHPEWYNCTSVDNGADGFTRSGGSGTDPTAINCVGFGNGGSDFVGASGWAGATATNASEDLTAPGSSPQTGVAGSDFTDTANDDYSIADTGAPMYNNGTDIASTLSGFDRTDYTVPIEDIIETSRPQATTWDIGAFEFVAAAGETIVVSAASLTFGEPVSVNLSLATQNANIISGNANSIDQGIGVAGASFLIGQPASINQSILVPRGNSNIQGQPVAFNLICAVTKGVLRLLGRDATFDGAQICAIDAGVLNMVGQAVDIISAAVGAELKFRLNRGKGVTYKKGVGFKKVGSEFVSQPSNPEETGEQ